MTDIASSGKVKDGYPQDRWHVDLEHHGFFIPPLLLSLGLGTGARVAGGAAVRAAGSAAARRAAQEAATKAALSGGASQTKKNIASTPGGWKNLFNQLLVTGQETQELKELSGQRKHLHRLEQIHLHKKQLKDFCPQW